MSEFPHDDFAKSYLSELLNTIGTTTPNMPLQPETREADLWFEVNPAVSVAQQQQLGLLGALMTRNALIEVFHNPTTPVEIRSCQSKLSILEGRWLRQAKRQRESVKEANLPMLWLLTPTASLEIRQGFGTVPTEHPGVYRFPRMQRVGLIVLHRLEKTPETMWLRVLGRARVQQQAMEELHQRRTASGLYDSVEELLVNYRADLESRGQLTLEEETLIMKLSAAYLQKQQEWKEEGRIEERREMVLNCLRSGADPEVITRMTGVPIAEVLELQKQL